MKAALLYGDRDLRIEDLEDPVPEERQVLIDIKACGVCPSDVRWYTGARKPDRYPRRLGHEWAGDVVSVGSLVEGFQPGDRVVPDWRVVCGECYYCRRGIFGHCTRSRHELVSGGFCERGVAITSNLRIIPETVSYEEACFTEPLACCLNGIRRSEIRPGSDVVVMGLGPIGLMHTQLARYHGARVIACDRIPGRLQKARELGADETIHVDQQDPVANVRKLTGGRGADAIVVAVGSMKAAEMAIQMAGISASVNLFAGFYPPGKLDLDPNVIHYKEINLTGSHDFTPHDFTMALKLVECGVVKLKPLISHRLPLPALLEGFEAVLKQEGLKVVIETQE